ncbi:MAG: dTMP kinase [Desulfovibrionaceae bacterium]|nr:dTMP kinase [Desulfovibrionaceae bacterium]
MFVTFEGVDGSGKTTIMEALACELRAQGHKVCATREPGGSALGKSLRELLLHTETKITKRAELLLFLADRAEHVATVIKPALAAGQVVLCDRYIDSTLCYQGYGRGLELNELRFLNSVATANLFPDLTLVLDVPIEIGLKRALSRADSSNTCRFEQEALQFHAKVRQGYLEEAAISPRFRVVDASQAFSQVLASCRAHLLSHLASC